MKMIFEVIEYDTTLEFVVDVPKAEYEKWAKQTTIKYNEIEYNASIKCRNSDGTIEMLLTRPFPKKGKSKGAYSFDFKYMKGCIDYSNPIANMVKPPTKEENIQILKHELKVAIRNEDYELCAKLRDKINEL